MRISIKWRMFAAVAAVSTLVTLAALLLTRWQLIADFGAYTARVEMDNLTDLRQALAAQYRQRGDWSFLPAPEQRRQWLHRELQRIAEQRTERIETLPVPGDAVHDTPPQPPAPPPPPGESAVSATKTVFVEPPPAPPAPAFIGDVPVGLVARITLFDAQHAVLLGSPLAATARLDAPIVVDGRIAGVLGINRTEQPEGELETEFLLNQISSLVLALLFSVLMSAVAAALLAAHFRRPIQALLNGTRALRRTQFSTRISIDRSDELGELAADFNQLAEKLDHIEHARQQWISDTSHELRTPLAVMRAQLEAMQDGVRPCDGDNLELLLRQLQGMNHLVDDLFALAQADEASPPATERLDLGELLADKLRAVEARLQQAQLSLQWQLPREPCFVTGNSQRLLQVFGNLLENSIRYTAPGGTVRITLTHAAGQAVLSIEDSAPGVPDAALGQLGERFFRVDASRSRASGGAGLGLSLCRKLLTAFGGSLHFSHSTLGGLRVEIHLPCTRE